MTNSVRLLYHSLIVFVATGSFEKVQSALKQNLSQQEDEDIEIYPAEELLPKWDKYEVTDDRCQCSFLLDILGHVCLVALYTMILIKKETQ